MTDKENTLELKCLNCGDKLGWHHGKNADGSMTKCYGIGCLCTKFEHNLCSLEPLFKSMK